MSEKRRDSKNRILRTGESQRSDGRYVFKYNPAPGVSKFAYSWRLTPTDPLPPGKSGGPSLREKEQAIRRDLEDGINPLGESMTLCQLYERHNALHPNVRESTVESRAILMRLLREDGFGLKPIGGIRPSDAKAWAIRMRDRGYAFNTIAGYKRSLTAAFYTARRDDLVRREPFNFKLSDVIENRTPPKLPLTPAQTRALLDFIEEDVYYFWGEPRYARAHPRPDGLFLLPHTPSTCDSAPVGRHVRNRGESACSSASRSATGGHGKPRRTRPVPDHPVRGFSTAA